MLKRIGASLIVIFVAGCAAAPETTRRADETAAPVALRPAEATLAAMGAEVSGQKLHYFIDRMVSFGTRHTLSDQVSDTRGIGAARRWVEAEFRAMGAECGGCLEIVTPSDTVTAPRIPDPTLVMNVVAIQRGTTEPNRVIIIQGHLDSRVTNVMNATADAPGANDDASGVAAVMETARILSKRKFHATLVYAALSGEEQGLFGGRILADYAKQQGWQVEAVLNNDIVGNSHGLAERVDDRVRIFTEGVRSNETPEIAAARKAVGGEVDAPSRNLGRYIQTVGARFMPDFDVMLVYRRDRFSRGGDQVPMVEAGFPAVRVTEAAENYTRQHQDIRSEAGVAYGDTIDGIDFPYLARVTKLNLLTMASLATAPAPPLEVKIEGAVSADTTVTWTAMEDAQGYVVWWRETTSAQWQHSRVVGPEQTSLKLEGVVIDDWFFGVSTLGPDGIASPVQFAGVVGAFFPPGEAGP